MQIAQLTINWPMFNRRSTVLFTTFNDKHSAKMFKYLLVLALLVSVALAIPETLAVHQREDKAEGHTPNDGHKIGSDGHHTANDGHGHPLSLRKVRSPGGGFGGSAGASSNANSKASAGAGGSSAYSGAQSSAYASGSSGGKLGGGSGGFGGGHSGSHGGLTGGSGGGYGKASAQGQGHGYGR